MTSKKTYTELPRLTSSLRAFSGLSSPYLLDREYGQPSELRTKREWKAKNDSKAEFNWQDLHRLVKRNISRDKENEVKNALRDLLNVAYKIAGKEASSEITQHTAIFLFNLLKECSNVSRNEVLKIEETFGPCHSSLINDAYNLVQQLVSYIPEHVLNKELQRTSNNDTKTEFGRGIKFYFPSCKKQTEDLSLLDSDTDDDDEKFKFSLNYNPEKWTDKEISPSSNSVVAESTKEKNNFKEINVNWLKQRCDLYFGSGDENLNSSDMCSVIFDILSSPRGNQEMQNELFELLGFERFEFIQELLTNRENIVVGTLRVADKMNGLYDEIT